jgi:hypothetical protein
MADMDGDGTEDLLLGAPLHTPEPGREEAGGGALVYGSASLIGQTIGVQNAGTYGGVLLLGGEADQRVGTTVAMGDLDGDGLGDLLLGSSFEAGSGGGALGGRVRMINATSLSENTLDLGQAAADVEILGSAENGFFSASMVAAGDINGDGFADLVATAPFEAAPNNGGTGMTYLVYGAGEPETTTSRTQFKPGDVSQTGIGGRLSPTARTYAAFTGGTEGYVESALVRNLDGLVNFSNVESAVPMHWNVFTTRTGWTGMTLSFEYTEAEIAGYNPEHLTMVAYPTMGDQWAFIGGTVHDPARRRFTMPAGDVEVLTHFVIVSLAPVIALEGEAELTVECGGSFTDPGATAFSRTDGDLTESLVIGGDTVDPSTPGVYVITYDVEDSQNRQAAQLTRTVTVADTTPPVLTLVGNAGLSIACGSAFSDPGVTAEDTCAGDLGDSVDVGGDAVDVFTPGQYVITYDVTDAEGNSAAQLQRTVTVEDTVVPTLTLAGAAVINLDCGAAWVDPGASAVDACDGVITGAIEVSGDTVNPNEEGTYVVLYNVQDAAGNAAPTRTRVVNVGPCGGEGEGEGQPEGEGEGQPEGEGEGQTEGEGEGQTEGETPATHNADQNADNQISLSELLRIIQFYNSGGLHCMGGTEDGFMPGVNAGAQGCAPHASDYNPQDWFIALTELLRTIQFYNIGGYHLCPGGEDGFCTGLL